MCAHMPTNTTPMPKPATPLTTAPMKVAKRKSPRTIVSMRLLLTITGKSSASDRRKDAVQSQVHDSELLATRAWMDVADAICSYRLIDPDFLRNYIEIWLPLKRLNELGIGRVLLPERELDREASRVRRAARCIDREPDGPCSFEPR